MINKEELDLGKINITTESKDKNLDNFVDDKIKTYPDSSLGEKDNMLNLDNIKIDENIKSVQKINFKNTLEKKFTKREYNPNYRRMFVISFLIIIISNLISLTLYFYNQYIYKSSTEDSYETNKTIAVNAVIATKNFISDILSANKGHSSANQSYKIYGADGVKNLDNIIKSKKSYIQKKDILKESIKELSNLIIEDHQSLDEIKKDITREGFLNKDVSQIISSEEQISSIQNSLLSLEAIKFSSAINVFPYLDTFLDGLSNVSNISKKEIAEKNNIILSRGDKDINLYLKNCYLNPFETNYECSIIGDFETYYTLTEQSKFDHQFFKQLIKYIDIKLEQTELPSFSINFKKFDKNNNKITFSIDINTFKEDEIELAKKGIFSPHIFILNNLVDNLRQNRFILGEGISVKTLKVEPKIISIGTTEFNINNSNKTFTVYIQKESEREITDFINIE